MVQHFMFLILSNLKCLFSEKVSVIKKTKIILSLIKMILMEILSKLVTDLQYL